MGYIHLRGKLYKLFKGTNLKVAFKTANTVGKLLTDTHTANTYEQSGIYKMACQSCHEVYIGPKLNDTQTTHKV
jgi:hypothetical protein